MIFVDADAYIALMVVEDSNHIKAVNILKEIKNVDLMTSWDVIDEVATKLSYFTTKKLACDFLEVVFGSKIKIGYVDEVIKIKVIKLFKRQISKRVSMTDCVNMVLAKENGIKKFFSFDKHYKKNGFELV